MRQVVVNSGTGLRHEIKAGAHKLVADAPEHAGGAGHGPDPHELLLAALGACTSMTLKIFAAKRQWDLKDVNVILQEDEVDDPANPGKKMFKITREIKVSGNLTAEQLDSLKSIADKCPVHKLLVGQKEITTELHAG